MVDATCHVRWDVEPPWLTLNSTSRCPSPNSSTPPLSPCAAYCLNSGVLSDFMATRHSRQLRSATGWLPETKWHGALESQRRNR